jgi:hypothetical protein
VCFIDKGKVKKYLALLYPEEVFTGEEVQKIHRLVRDIDHESRVGVAVDIFGRMGLWELPAKVRSDLQPGLTEEIVNGLQGRGERHDSLGSFLASANASSQGSVMFFREEPQ